MKTILKEAKHLLSVSMALSMCLFTLSCNKSDSQNDVIINYEARQFFLTVNDDINDFIRENKNVTYEEIQRHIIEKHDEQVSSEIKDSLLVISLPDGYQIYVDLFEKSFLKGNWEDFDELDLEKISQEISKELGLDDDSETKERSRSSINNSIWTRSNSDNAILINRDVYIWAPIEEQAAGAKEIIKKINIKLEKTYKGLNMKKWFVFDNITKGRDCTPYSMNEFNKYGLVLIFAHGLYAPGEDDDGSLLLPCPSDFRFEDLPNAKDRMEKEVRDLNIRHTVITLNDNYWVLKSEHLLDTKCLPQDLKHTIIWATVCFSQKRGSQVKRAFDIRKPGLYVGTEDIAYINSSMDCFKDFALLFYAGEEARDAWRNGTKSSYGNKNAKYIMSTYSDEDIYVYDHVNAKARKEEQNNARVSVIFPSDHVTASVGTRSFSTRSPMHRNDNVGVSFKNVKTNKVIEYLLDENNCTIEKKYEYIGLTHYILRLNTDDLEEGTYEYRTYREIDGEKEYSDSIYEFTVKKGSFCPDNNHPHAIDLGLPSGNKWSCCELGASEPLNIGGRYPWGYVTPIDPQKYKEDYGGIDGMDPMYSGYKYGPRVIYYKDTYHCQSDFEFLGDDISETQYDAVYKSDDWGNGWVMPNLKDFRELIDCCAFEYVTNDDKNYYKIIGPNGNYINLRYLNFWSSTLGPTNSVYPKNYMCAYALYGEINNNPIIDIYLRWEPFGIWPVYKKSSGK